MSAAESPPVQRADLRPPLPALIASPRLHITLATAPELRAIAGDHPPAWCCPGYPIPETLQAIGLAAAAQVSGLEPLDVRLIRRLHDGLVVGDLALWYFAATPNIAYIAYGLAPAARGNGFATESVCAVAAAAFAADRSLMMIEGEADRSNLDSMAVLRRAGFVLYAVEGDRRLFRRYRRSVTPSSQ